MSRASRGWKIVSLGCYFLRLRMKSRGVLCLTKSSLTTTASRKGEERPISTCRRVASGESGMPSRHMQLAISASRPSAPT
eukprot:scaffold38919_cov26-Phaeocystis_antarctica.AAC.1